VISLWNWGSPQEKRFLDKINAWFNPEPKKEAKLHNTQSVYFFIKILPPYISFSCSIYMSLLHEDFDSKTLRKWKEMLPLITIMFWWLINANKRLQNDSQVDGCISAWRGYTFTCSFNHHGWIVSRRYTFKIQLHLTSIVLL